MKILKGIKKSEFINNYCNHSKEKQFLLIDTIDNSYPFTAENLLLIKSNKNNWLNNFKEADKELSKDVVFILFTNDKLDHKEEYKNILNNFNRDIIIALQDKSKFMMSDAEIEEI